MFQRHPGIFSLFYFLKECPNGQRDGCSGSDSIFWRQVHQQHPLLPRLPWCVLRKPYRIGTKKYFTEVENRPPTLLLQSFGEALLFLFGKVGLSRIHRTPLELEAKGNGGCMAHPLVFGHSKWVSKLGTPLDSMVHFSPCLNGCQMGVALLESHFWGFNPKALLAWPSDRWRTDDLAPRLFSKRNGPFGHVAGCSAGEGFTTRASKVRAEDKPPIAVGSGCHLSLLIKTHFASLAFHLWVVDSPKTEWRTLKEQKLIGALGRIQEWALDSAKQVPRYRIQRHRFPLRPAVWSAPNRWFSLAQTQKNPLILSFRTSMAEEGRGLILEENKEPKSCCSCCCVLRWTLCSAVLLAGAAAALILCVSA